MADYAVKITIKNGRILRLMREAGIETVAELSRRCGVRQQELGKIINLKTPPMGKDGTWLDAVENMAGALRCDPEDMFTEVQQTLAIESNSRTVDMDEAQVMALASGDAERQAWAKLESQKLLAVLSPRQRDVMEKRMDGMTLDEIGQESGVTRTAIAVVEAKAIRKMKAAAYRAEKEFASKFVKDLPKAVPNPNWKSRAQRERERQEQFARKQSDAIEEQRRRMAAMRGIWFDQLRNREGNF